MTAYTTSGSAISTLNLKKKIKKKGFRFFNQMQFLNDFIISRV